MGVFFAHYLLLTTNRKAVRPIRSAVWLWPSCSFWVNYGKITLIFPIYSPGVATQTGSRLLTVRVEWTCIIMYRPIIVKIFVVSVGSHGQHCMQAVLDACLYASLDLAWSLSVSRELCKND